MVEICNASFNGGRRVVSHQFGGRGGRKRLEMTRVTAWVPWVAVSLKVTRRRTTMNIKKSVRLNLDIVLEYHNSLIVFWLHALLTEEIDFEIGHFRNFWNSVNLTMTLDHHKVYCRVSLINLYLYTEFFSNPFVAGRTDIDNGFIMLTRSRHRNATREQNYQTTAACVV